MRIRTLAVALAVVLAIPVAASAAPPSELEVLLERSDYAQQVGLTADDPDSIPPGVMSDAEFAKVMTRAEFVEAAADVAGLSTSEARAAYQDPVARALMPTSQEEEVLYEGPTKEALTEGLNAYKYRARTKCVKTVIRAYMQTAAWFKHCKRWQYNGSRTRNASVWTRQWRAAWAPYIYEGVIEAGGHYSSWRGRTRGQHWSYRAASFQGAIPWSINIITSSEIWGRYNGSVYSRNHGTS